MTHLLELGDVDNNNCLQLYSNEVGLSVFVLLSAHAVNLHEKEMSVPNSKEHLTARNT